MKKVSIAIVLAAVLVMGQAIPASAINKEWSAVLGLLGGYMVANGGLSQRTVVYETTPVVVERPVVRQIVVEEPVDMGHYEYRDQRVWIPGRWVLIEGPCGYERLWKPGYYQVSQVRVWVPGCQRVAHRRCRR